MKAWAKKNKGNLQTVGICLWLLILLAGFLFAMYMIAVEIFYESTEPKELIK